MESETITNKILPLPANVKATIRTGVSLTSFAQAVEELVLNSIDAGATSVAVRVDLPFFKIQVVDNGSGFPLDQFSYVGERYSTSKCHTVEDLNNLKYFGYRGEALASLAAASSFLEITSRAANSNLTYTKSFHNGKPQCVAQAAVPRPCTGATITAFNLFHNLPVRRKRLSEALEMEALRYRLSGIALMWPQVSFSLRDDSVGHVILQTHKCSGTAAAFSSIFTPARARKLMEVEAVRKDEFMISGLVSIEGYSRKDLQFVFVNKRLVLKSAVHKQVNKILGRSLILRRKGLNIEMGSQLPTVGDDINGSPTKQADTCDRYGIFVISIECPYKAYDITFDPAKTLIEFRNWPKLIRLLQDWFYPFLRKHNLLTSNEPFTPLLSEEPGIFIVEDYNGDASSESSEPIRGQVEENRMTSQLLRYGRNISISDTQNGILSKSVHRPRKTPHHQVPEESVFYKNSDKSKAIVQNFLAHSTDDECRLLNVSDICDMTEDTHIRGLTCWKKQIERCLDNVKSQQPFGPCTFEERVPKQKTHFNRNEMSEGLKGVSSYQSSQPQQEPDNLFSDKTKCFEENPKKVRFSMTEENEEPLPSVAFSTVNQTEKTVRRKEITLSAGCYTSTLQTLRESVTGRNGTGSENNLKVPNLITNTLQQFRISARQAVRGLGDLYKTPDRVTSKRTLEGPNSSDCEPVISKQAKMIEFSIPDSNERDLNELAIISKGEFSEADCSKQNSKVTQKEQCSINTEKNIEMPTLRCNDGNYVQPVPESDLLSSHNIQESEQRIPDNTKDKHRGAAATQFVKDRLNLTCHLGNSNLTRHSPVLSKNVEELTATDRPVVDTGKSRSFLRPLKASLNSDIILTSNVGSESGKSLSHGYGDAQHSKLKKKSFQIPTQSTKLAMLMRGEISNRANKPSGASESLSLLADFQYKKCNTSDERKAKSKKCGRTSVLSQESQQHPTEEGDAVTTSACKSTADLGLNHYEELFHGESSSNSKGAISKGSLYTKEQLPGEAISCVHSKLVCDNTNYNEERIDSPLDSGEKACKRLSWPGHQRVWPSQLRAKAEKRQTNAALACQCCCGRYISQQPHHGFCCCGNPRPASSNNQQAIPFQKYKDAENTVSEVAGPKLSVILSLPLAQTHSIDVGQRLHSRKQGAEVEPAPFSTETEPKTIITSSEADGSRSLDATKRASDASSPLTSEGFMLSCQQSLPFVEDVKAASNPPVLPSQGFSVNSLNHALSGVETASSEEPSTLMRLKSNENLTKETFSDSHNGKGYLDDNCRKCKCSEDLCAPISATSVDLKSSLLCNEDGFDKWNKTSMSGADSDIYLQVSPPLAGGRNETCCENQVPSVCSISPSPCMPETISLPGSSQTAPSNTIKISNKDRSCQRETNLTKYFQGNHMDIPQLKDAPLSSTLPSGVVISSNISESSLNAIEKKTSYDGHNVKGKSLTTNERDLTCDHFHSSEDGRAVQPRGDYVKGGLGNLNSPRENSKTSSVYKNRQMPVLESQSHYFQKVESMDFDILNGTDMLSQQSKQTLNVLVTETLSQNAVTTLMKEDTNQTNSQSRSCESQDCNQNTLDCNVSADCEKIPSQIFESLSHDCLAIEYKSPSCKVNNLPYSGNEKQSVDVEEFVHAEDHKETSSSDLPLAQLSGKCAEISNAGDDTDSFPIFSRTSPLHLSGTESLKCDSTNQREITSTGSLRLGGKTESLLDDYESAHGNTDTDQKNDNSAKSSDVTTYPLQNNSIGKEKSCPSAKPSTGDGSESLFEDSVDLNVIAAVNTFCSSAKAKDPKSPSHSQDLRTKSSEDKARIIDTLCNITKKVHRQTPLSDVQSKQVVAASESSPVLDMTETDKVSSQRSSGDQALFVAKLPVEDGVRHNEKVSGDAEQCRMIFNKKLMVGKETLQTGSTPLHSAKSTIDQTPREPISVCAALGSGLITSSLSLLRQQAIASKEAQSQSNPDRYENNCDSLPERGTSCEVIDGTEDSASESTSGNNTHQGKTVHSNSCMGIFSTQLSCTNTERDEEHNQHLNMDVHLLKNCNVRNVRDHFNARIARDENHTLADAEGEVNTSGNKNVQTSEAEDAPPQPAHLLAHLLKACWRQETDALKGKKVFVNNQSGHTVTEDQWPEMSSHLLMEMTTTPENTSKVLKTKARVDQVLPPISADDRQVLTNVISACVEEVEAEADTKWRGGRERTYEKEAGMDVSTLLSKWSNPTFPHYKAPSIEAELCPNAFSAKSCFKSLSSIEFSKDILKNVKVIGQVDKKFIACEVELFRSKSKDLPSSLLILFDQHAVHERIRVEYFTQECFVVNNGERTSMLKMAQIDPPYTVLMDPDDVCILRAFSHEFTRIGVTLVDGEDSRTSVRVNSVPACLLEREAGEAKRKKASSLEEKIECLIKEHVGLLKSTNGACGRLPLMLHKHLCSLACHGAVKFGDELTLSECKDLLSALSRCNLPFQCAHGRPAVAPLIDVTALRDELDSTKKKPRLWKICPQRV